MLIEDGLQYDVSIFALQVLPYLLSSSPVGRNLGSWMSQRNILSAACFQFLLQRNILI